MHARRAPDIEGGAFRGLQRLSRSGGGQDRGLAGDGAGGPQRSEGARLPEKILFLKYSGIEQFEDVSKVFR